MKPHYIRCGYAAGCEAWLCLAGKRFHKSWAKPLVRPLAHKLRAKPEPWAQPNLQVWAERRGRASPHIRRHSRSRAAKATFRASHKTQNQDQRLKTKDPRPK